MFQFSPKILEIGIFVFEYCRLYIKQPPSRTSISGHDPEPEWAEYKIKETNMFTVDKYQQVRLIFDINAFDIL